MRTTSEPEQPVGKLWVHQDANGSRYLRGTAFTAIEAGAHIRLRRTGKQTKGGADEYALLVESGREETKATATAEKRPRPCRQRIQWSMRSSRRMQRRGECEMP